MPGRGHSSRRSSGHRSFHGAALYALRPLQLAVGAGEPAAIAAGINVDRTKIIAFAVSGTLAAIAGVILAARLSSGSPSLANQLLLPAIAAVIVGGTAITGGLGGVARTAVGALIISIVRIGMTFIGVNIFFENVVFGAC
jgi:ribose transport system permease protein